MAVLSLQVLAALAFWIAMSASMIIFNAALLQGFRHPVWLTFWHQSVSSLLVFLLRLIKPSLVSTGDDKDGRPALTFLGALRIGVPVAAAQCVGLIAGNTAVMYISVSFCQMIKAWTPACVYVVGCLVGTQKWSSATAKTLATITTGLMITSVGELKFELYGFIMQCTALLSEGLRINLLEILLKSAGYKLNPLSSVMVFAPVASSILLIIGIVTDPDAVSIEVLHNIGEVALAANALIAFLLNIAIYIAIQVASGLIYALAGIVKDISIIMGSVILMGSPVSGIQVLGYVIALLGIQAYGQVSKAPAKFEMGVINGLYRELKGGHMSQLDPVTPLSVGAAVVSRSGKREPNNFEFLEVDDIEKAKTEMTHLESNQEDDSIEPPMYRERNGRSDSGSPRADLH